MQNKILSDQPNILFVNPWIHDFAAYDVWAKPLGLLYLAAIARKAKANVFYIDCLDRFHPMVGKTPTEKQDGRGPYLKTKIKNPKGLEKIPRKFSRYGIKKEWFKASLETFPKPDIIFMTSQMTYWYTGVQETIFEVKKIFPDVPLLLGGIYAGLCTDHAGHTSGADAVIPGPGENKIIALVNSYTGADLTCDINPEDLNTYPYPAFDLQNKINYVPILTSRGCPFNCDYCASNFLEPKRKKREPAHVVDEIFYWHEKHQITNFVIYDDAFLVEAASHAEPILEKIVNSGLKLSFHTPNALHIRNISKKIADLLYQAGFKTLRLGLERIPYGKNVKLDRKVTLREYLDTISLLKSAGFKKDAVGAYLLVGLPDQSWEEIEHAIKFVKESGITPIPAYYTPIPHTALWPKAVESSRYDIDNEPLFTNNAIFPCSKDDFSWDFLTKIKKLVLK